MEKLAEVKKRRAEATAKAEEKKKLEEEVRRGDKLEKCVLGLQL